MTATAENAVLARDAGGFAAGGVNGGRSCKGDGWADGALPSLVLWKSFLNCAPAPRKNAAILLSKSPKSVYGSFATWERGALKLLTGGEVRAIKVYLLGLLFIAGGISVAFAREAVSRRLSRDLGPFTVSYAETHEECLNRLVAEGAGDLRECSRSRAGVH
jgi:hypothetical protein